MSFDETIKINFDDINRNVLIRFQMIENTVHYTLVKENNLENEFIGIISDLKDFEKIETNSEKIMYLLNKLKEEKII